MGTRRRRRGAGSQILMLASLLVSLLGLLGPYSAMPASGTALYTSGAPLPATVLLPPEVPPFGVARRQRLALTALQFPYADDEGRIEGGVFQLPVPLPWPPGADGARSWELNVPHGAPIFLLAALTRAAHGFSAGAAVTIDGQAVPNLEDFCIRGLRLPDGDAVREYAAIALVLAAPEPGRHAITVACNGCAPKDGPWLPTVDAGPRTYLLNVAPPTAPLPAALPADLAKLAAADDAAADVLPVLDAVLTNRASPGAPGAGAAGTVLDRTFYSSALGRNMPYRIYLPPGYGDVPGPAAAQVAGITTAPGMPATAAGVPNALATLTLPATTSANAGESSVSTGSGESDVTGGDDDTVGASDPPAETDERVAMTSVQISRESQASPERESSPILATLGQPGRRYPVVYLLHGLGASYRQWSNLGLIDELNRQFAGDASGGAQFIVVMPAGRAGYWTNHADGGPRWGDYVAQDLIAHVDTTYRTIARADARAIGGISMGAHGALELWLNNPTLFGAVGAHSPALRTREQAPAFLGGLLPGRNGGPGPDAYAARDPISLVKRSQITRPVPLWIDIGNQDGWAKRAQELHGALLERGWLHEWQPSPGDHDPAYWRKRMSEYVRFYRRALAQVSA